MAKQIPLEEGYFVIPEDASKPVQLIGSYSKAADKYYFPRRKLCPITFEPVEDVLLPPEGTLYSWTYIEMPMMGNMQFSEAGHGVGQVDLPGGVRVQAVIEGKMGDWEIGMPMKLVPLPVTTDNQGNELCTFAFAPVEKK